MRWLLLWAAVLGAGAARSDAWKVLPIYGGGYMMNVVLCPSDPNRLYTYVDVGGPYRSDDAGRSWQNIHGTFTSAQRQRSGAHFTRGLSVDPRDADKIVVASGYEPLSPGGIFVSQDGGKSYRQTLYCGFVSNGRDRFLGEVLVRNPFDPDELLCGQNRDGLYRSRDGGESWRPLGLDGHWFVQIYYDPNAKGRVYALSPAKYLGEKPQRSYEHLLGPFKTGLYRSDDSGDTWTKLSDSSPLELRVLKGTGEMLGGFVTGQGERWHEQRLSRDGGRTWQAWSEGLAPVAGPDEPLGDCSARGYRAMAAMTGAFLVANGQGQIFRRSPGEAKWMPVVRESITLDRPDCETHLSLAKEKRLVMDELNTIVVDPKDETHWFATDWNLLYESRDAGRNWVTRQNGIMQLVTHTLVFDPFSADNIFCGVADRGHLISHDGGKSYHHAVHPEGSSIQGNHPYALSAGFSARTPGLVYAVGGKKKTPLYRSADAGRSWRAAACRSLPEMRVGAFPVYGLGVSPVDDRLFVCVGGTCAEGRGGVYVSEDCGESFRRFSKGLPDGQDLFKSFEWDGCEAEQIFLSRDGSAILRTPKIRRQWYLDGEEWKPLKTYAVPVADPHAGGRFLFVGWPIFETLDGGRTVRPANGLPMHCSSIAFDAQNRGHVVFNVGDRILFSKDGGAHCSVVPDGMSVPLGDKHNLYLDRSRLFGRSAGSGVFVRMLEHALGADAPRSGRNGCRSVSGGE